jgi:hypothetical protein
MSRSARRYSVPWRFIGTKVDARATATTVQLFCKGELIATHPFKARSKLDRLLALPSRPP